jgi:hypothetical protein
MVRTTYVLTGTTAVMAAVTTGVPHVLTANARELIAHRSTSGVARPTLGIGAQMIGASEISGAVCGIGTLRFLAEVVVVAVLNSGTVLIATTSTPDEPDTVTALAGSEFAPSIAQEATCGAFGGRALTFDTFEAASAYLTIVDIAVTVVVDTVAHFGGDFLVGDLYEQPDLEGARPTVERPHAGVGRAGARPLVPRCEGKSQQDLVLSEPACGQGNVERLFLSPSIAHRAAAYGYLVGHARQRIPIIAEPTDLITVGSDDDLFLLHCAVGCGVVYSVQVPLEPCFSRDPCNTVVLDRHGQRPFAVL